MGIFCFLGLFIAAWYSQLIFMQMVEHSRDVNAPRGNVALRLSDVKKNERAAQLAGEILPRHWLR